MLHKLPEQQLDRQYRRPTGVVGRVIGRRMARDHQTENRWTVALLQAQSTNHILEVGFGPGLAIQELTKVVTEGRITGIDYSRAMVAMARRRNAVAHHAGLVDVQHGNVDNLPFSDNSFDIVFGIHTIYFWAHPLNALRETYRVLKPGGRISLTILPREKWNLNDPTAAVGTAECRAYSTDEIVEMLTGAGFSTTQIVVDPRPDRPSNCCVSGIKPL